MLPQEMLTHARLRLVGSLTCKKASHWLLRRSRAPLGSDDVLILCQHEQQLADFKKELCDIRTSLLSVDLEDGDQLNGLQASLEKAV